MSWTRRFDRYFSTGIRTRGLDYFRSGRVLIRAGDSYNVEAEVIGTGTYRVGLRLSEGDLRVDCTCPYFDSEYENCKHIWAAMAAAERDGHLSALMYVPNARLLDDALDEEAAFDLEDNPDAGESPRRGALSSPYTDREPAWKSQMTGLIPHVPPRTEHGRARDVGYVVESEESRTQGVPVIRVLTRRRKKSGDWGVFNFRLTRIDSFSSLPEEDRRILALLSGAREYAPHGHFYPGANSRPAAYHVPPEVLAFVMPLLCGTGRCYLGGNADSRELTALTWDDGPPWEFWLESREDADTGDYMISGSLRREADRIPLFEPSLLVPGVIFIGARVARFDDHGAFAWIPMLREDGVVTVPAQDRESFLGELLALGALPRLDMPDELRVEREVLGTPELRILAFDAAVGVSGIACELRFKYPGAVLAFSDPHLYAHDEESGRFFWRDVEGEGAAVSRLRDVGFKVAGSPHGSKWTIPQNGFADGIKHLLEDGWNVEASGRALRTATSVRVEVRSGVDWFDLEGGADFDGQSVGLPQLLKAVRRGERTVVLGDGTVGLLPEKWLERYLTVAALASSEEETIRFSHSQVALLDFLLAAEPAAVFDDEFIRVRDQVRDFAGILPLDPAVGFRGTLRNYQREGLGWLEFLREFGFGGCLADDMGLGKTVQVLALMAGRYTGDTGPGHRPSLVVAPRSLIFNWKDEAERFVPRLRILDYTGTRRHETRGDFANYDLIVTTYATVRLDASSLKDYTFDTLVLDEAQAIKNATTASAKAARLLRANHRLALSGTPVENHLGELWSVFDVLNPGMLGSVAAFEGALSNAAANNGDLEMLSRALRPFILRRTKSEVAPELPAKVEQTIYCEMKPSQRQLYNELKQYYRQSLLRDADDAIIKRSKIRVLEALLRLRQAACHPGLIDKARSNEPSAKLDALIPQIVEVIEGGSKALVFSQFTSLLGIVRDRLDEAGITYEYLDGRTRNRATRVARFQSDAACSLFLISLKAGGLGLNLTAAEYVFILDPWWNPAVEAQAIDRTHRIGQIHQVFAYRLIARDTVEDRILELQQTKRSLADAIISSDNSLIRTLGREDLEVLFS